MVGTAVDHVSRAMWLAAASRKRRASSPALSSDHEALLGNPAAKRSCLDCASPRETLSQELPMAPYHGRERPRPTMGVRSPEYAKVAEEEEQEEEEEPVLFGAPAPTVSTRSGSVAGQGSSSFLCSATLAPHSKVTEPDFTQPVTANLARPCSAEVPLKEPQHLSDGGVGASHRQPVVYPTISSVPSSVAEVLREALSRELLPVQRLLDLCKVALVKVPVAASADPAPAYIHAVCSALQLPPYSPGFIHWSESSPASRRPIYVPFRLAHVLLPEAGRHTDVRATCAKGQAGALEGQDVVGHGVPAAPPPTECDTVRRHVAKCFRIPMTEGAVTKLFAVSQLEQLLALRPLKSELGKLYPPTRRPSFPVSPDRTETLTLLPGESIALIIYEGPHQLAEVVDHDTFHTGDVRVITLDISDLPREEVITLLNLHQLFHPADSGSPAGVRSRCGRLMSPNESEFQVPHGHLGKEPMEPCAKGDERSSHNASATSTDVSNSVGLQIRQEHRVVVQHLSDLLRVNEILNPWAVCSDRARMASSPRPLMFPLDLPETELPGSLLQSSLQSVRSQPLMTPGSQEVTKTTSQSLAHFPRKLEELVLPALIFWRVSCEVNERGARDTSCNEAALSQEEMPRDVLELKGGPLVVKQLHDASFLHSLSLLRPVYTAKHLVQCFLDSLRAQGVTCPAAVPWGEEALSPPNSGHHRWRCGSPIAADPAGGGGAPAGMANPMPLPDDSRALVYLGASWCPPCMKIVREMPQMLRADLPQSVCAAFKADMDLAPELFELLGVTIIPTFIVLDCSKLLEAVTTATAKGAGSSPMIQHFVVDQAIREGVKSAVIASLQNSQRPMVRTFIEKHCAPLRFDDTDF